MSSTSERSSEEMFLCSICLEVFSEPVSTPCGHNFCRRCISQAWDTDGPCRCPLCNEVFHSRPKLKVNTLLKEAASEFNLQKNKIRSMEAILDCLSSYCERHQLMEPVKNLEDRECPTRQQPLVLFCSTDEKSVCMMCSVREHKNHEFLSLEEACEGSVARALSELENSLPQEFNKHFKELKLKRAQQSAVEVTLDPDTAHPHLVLSEDLKQVHCGDVKKKLPDSPLKFDYYVIVLGKQSFSSGRFYFEVRVKGKIQWDLGVARESINRKGKITASPKHGVWSIHLRNKDVYKACAGPSVRLFPQRAPQKVGVFVDYGKGLVSFYDADSADLLFSFTDCCFREKMFPYFSPCLNEGGSNSAPLVLTAVETLSSDKVQK